MQNYGAVSKRFVKIVRGSPSFGTGQGKSDQLYPKNSTQDQRGKVCLSKSVLFFFLCVMPPPEQTGGFPTGLFVFYGAVSVC